MKKNKLSPLAWQVTQEKGTEPPFSGEYDHFFESGKYHCICCDSLLFKSDHKFDSGCGWPAFYQAIEENTIEKEDTSHGMIRTEVLCKNCNAHLGHKFPDGPYGTRYCINSVAMEFKADTDSSEN
ncbi:MAG: peptide-methionine (R)-S-oxide reductase MsrB [Gammaproteobacteria bacterium]|nr:peptide-methionine (R)-S-oxide reductase MsrB [Gammaproteobacteria bacterium]MDH5629785.1 peptide-methionine (R)-S-oxide reductase MsrB [Gammaproteobacteria bacterium]